MVEAANAEESASASEEMNAQAEQLREYVQDLFVLVSGTKDPNPGGKKQGRQLTLGKRLSSKSLPDESLSNKYLE